MRLHDRKLYSSNDLFAFPQFCLWYVYCLPMIFVCVYEHLSVLCAYSCVVTGCGSVRVRIVGVWWRLPGTGSHSASVTLGRNGVSRVDRSHGDWWATGRPVTACGPTGHGRLTGPGPGEDQSERISDVTQDPVSSSDL